MTTTDTPVSNSQRAIPAHWLPLLAGLVAVGSIVGWGVYGAFHHQVDGVSDAQSEEEIAFLDLADESHFNEASRPSTATLTDVVPAVHQMEGHSQPSIVQVAGERPASNPSAWLAGTIEEVAPEAFPQPRTLEFARRRFDSTNIR